MQKIICESCESMSCNPIGDDCGYTPPEFTREGILRKAEHMVCGHREQDYGSPEDNFATIAGLWSVYLDVEVSSADVAALMALMKIARLKGKNKTLDTWVDLAGYAACGGECTNLAD